MTTERVKPTDHSVPVLIEALYHCGCPVAGNMTVGDCAETDQCGCSVNAARLKGCMGPDHQSVRLAALDHELPTADDVRGILSLEQPPPSTPGGG